MCLQKGQYFLTEPSIYFFKSIFSYSFKNKSYYV